MWFYLIILFAVVTAVAMYLKKIELTEWIKLGFIAGILFIIIGIVWLYVFPLSASSSETLELVTALKLEVMNTRVGTVALGYYFILTSLVLLVLNIIKRK